MITLYTCLVFFHILLFVFWLGGDLGVAILGSHFRKRTYSVPERLIILKLLVINDLGPRMAWALMIGCTISMLHTGGYWTLPAAAILAAWAVSAFWLWLIIASYRAGQTPKAAKLKSIEFALKCALCVFYLSLGIVSLLSGDPLAPHWLAAKAVLFGLIFIAAILIDVKFKALSPALGALIKDGSSDHTEAPILAIMNKTRFWVRVVYVLLVLTAFIGTAKFF